MAQFDRSHLGNGDKAENKRHMLLNLNTILTDLILGEDRHIMAEPEAIVLLVKGGGDNRIALLGNAKATRQLLTAAEEVFEHKMHELEAEATVDDRETFEPDDTCVDPAACARVGFCIPKMLSDRLGYAPPKRYAGADDGIRATTVEDFFRGGFPG